MESIVAVGIDVAKEKLDVAVFNGKKFVTRIYSNTKEGIERFLKDIEEKYVDISKDSIHFVMEATGSTIQRYSMQYLIEVILYMSSIPLYQEDTVKNR